MQALASAQQRAACLQATPTAHFRCQSQTTSASPIKYQAGGFRPFNSQPGQPQRQRTLRLRAVGESTPALQRPAARKPLPELQKPERKAESTPESQASPTKEAPDGSPGDGDKSSGQVTIQFQREQAKAMRNYFKGLAYREEVVKSQVFGWTPKNEITNGRWVMFGFAVGLLTEYATGADFIQQLKLMVSYLGIADIYD